MIRLATAVLTFSCLALLGGCEWMPGKPKPSSKWEAPTDIVDFKILFHENCLGCHGDGKHAGPAIMLNDPLYLAIIPKEKMLEVVNNGIPGTGMPGFSQAKGGMLTDAQVNIIVDGIYKNWSGTAPAGPLPAYAAAPGDVTAGQALYEAYVAALKKNHPAEMFRDGFMANPYFLDLVSDQYLRTLLITGRPDLGIPDFRNAIPGQPLSDQNIADITAWLISQRKNEFGQPVPAATPQP